MNPSRDDGGAASLEHVMRNFLPVVRLSNRLAGYSETDADLLADEVCCVLRKIYAPVMRGGEDGEAAFHAQGEVIVHEIVRLVRALHDLRNRLN